ncbi:hypothetical protein HRM2_28620 [Desulforapulum autotrophicum HRM2]|uniref:Uncharacterized protein n=2 Tax=Desulforapulum autotrophicum TaxID=2296 RepID=C0QJD7_DESAH|nr:hypothetical protein HRM2_28620 [Desulforapulum autotrophicum HRM2]
MTATRHTCFVIFIDSSMDLKLSPDIPPEPLHIKGSFYPSTGAAPEEIKAIFIKSTRTHGASILDPHGIFRYG